MVAPADAAGKVAPGPPTGPLAPVRSAAFAVLWTATMVSNIGTWMHDVAAGWLMTSLSPSPFMVALVQTATTLPVFLFSLPAGALADIVDRRRLLIAVQAVLIVTAGSLGLLVRAGLATPLTLLCFTFVMGTCAAFVAPAWQAIVPNLVPRSDLRPAVALNSVGINISRAIGPALAGIIIAGVGIWAPFFLNTLSFVIVVAALIWWHPPPAAARTLPPEQFLGALRAGLRYVRASRPMRANCSSDGTWCRWPRCPMQRSATSKMKIELPSFSGSPQPRMSVVTLRITTSKICI